MPILTGSILSGAISFARDLRVPRSSERFLAFSSIKLTGIFQLLSILDKVRSSQSSNNLQSTISAARADNRFIRERLDYRESRPEASIAESEDRHQRFFGSAQKERTVEWHCFCSRENIAEVFQDTSCRTFVFQSSGRAIFSKSLPQRNNSSFHNSIAAAGDATGKPAA